MGFVGNYAPYGLSPQVHDMPVILKKIMCLKIEAHYFYAFVFVVVAGGSSLPVASRHLNRLLYRT